MLFACITVFFVFFKLFLLFQVSCLTVHENLNFMAVGFENGSIVLFKGDVTRER